ncbi:hypothetical protein [Salinibacterium sp. M195]|uniref:hypothetical protein n=1 Tax=Salinibacterium sp. M195 TaxID=2583374 RepID=UPI001C625ECC|nr:hypothetical protein [Salinibacterium sp. M195]QYH35200.1 hypothetical protein FFT87_04095 [Salinibacterium sp. M195]
MSARISQMTAGEVRARAEHARDSLLTAQLRFEPRGPMASNNTTGLNAVNAGIAAADAICGAKLGYRPNGQDHKQAVAILAQALPDKKTAARDLGRLLETKTLTSYGTSHITGTKASELLRYASRLVEEMESALTR